MKDGLVPALNGTNRLGDGVKTRAIQNIRVRNRWSVTAAIETVKTGVERAAKEGSDTPRTRERCKGLANTDEDEPGGTDAEADAHRGRDRKEARV